MEYQTAQMINAIIERLDIIIQQNQIIIKTMEKQDKEEEIEDDEAEDIELDQNKTGIKNIAREKVKVKA